MPSGDTTHREVAPPTPDINEENAPQASQQANLMKAIFI